MFNSTIIKQYQLKSTEALYLQLGELIAVGNPIQHVILVKLSIFPLSHLP